MIDVAREYGMGVDCRFHPSLRQWWRQKVSVGERYLMLEGRSSPCPADVDLRMHVHVGIEDRDLRIDLMGQVSYFLAHRWH